MSLQPAFPSPDCAGCPVREICASSEAPVAGQSQPFKLVDWPKSIAVTPWRACDACLACCCIGGIRDAWEFLWERCGDGIREAVIRKVRRLPPVADGDDLSSDCFVYFVEGAGRLLTQYDPAIGTLPEYLLGTAQRFGQRAARTRRVTWPGRQPPTSLHDVDLASPLPPGDPRRKLLQQALRRLNRRHRWLVSARYALGRFRKPKSPTWIAKRLGISRSQVHRQLKTALGALRAACGQVSPEPQDKASIAPKSSERKKGEDR